MIKDNLINLKVKDNLIGVMKVGNIEYISLTDIALEFASWIDTGFKLYLIKEFERLKVNEAYLNKKEWNVRRSISKTNYRIHTNSIKENIVPFLTDN